MTARSKHPRSCSICTADSKAQTKHFLPQLKAICRQNKTDRSKTLQNADRCTIKYISDCCDAILKDYIKFPDSVYPKLKKHKKDLLFLANSSNSLQKKRSKLVEQKGGFLQFLIPALASGLVGLAGDAIRRYI